MCATFIGLVSLFNEIIKIQMLSMTNRPTDTVYYGDARKHLKSYQRLWWGKHFTNGDDKTLDAPCPYLSLFIRHEPSFVLVISSVITMTSLPLARLFVVNKFVLLPFRHAFHFCKFFKPSLWSWFRRRFLSRKYRRWIRKLGQHRIFFALFCEGQRTKRG